MDESAVVTNVATILAKDLLLDRNLKFRPIPYPVQQFWNFLEDNDEGMDYFVYNMLRKRKVRTCRNGRTSKVPLDSGSTEGSRSMPDTTITPVPLVKSQTQKLEVNLRISQLLPPKDFEGNFHMKKGTFNALLEVLSPLMKNQLREIDNSLISKDTFLSLALWKLSTSQHFEEISQRFKIPAKVCHQISGNFCGLISSFINTFVSWPNMQHIIGLTTYKQTQMLGAIGTKHLDVFLESEDDEVDVILQLVCTSDLIIIDCYLELASKYSCHNSPILKKLASTSEPLPNGCYLVGDSKFPLMSSLITPYSDAKDQRKIQFNQYIEMQTKSVQNTIIQMMHRFQSLYSLEAKDLQEMKKTIETICGLYNFCRRFNDTCIPKLSESGVQEVKLPMKGDESNPNGIRRREQLLEIICP